jgi:Protein of unknown function (DUF3148)
MNHELQVGDRVRLTASPPYIKTAEPIPMLRPPTVVQLGEEGTILARQPGNTWSVRFQKGAYLLEESYLEKLETASSGPTSET